MKKTFYLSFVCLIMSAGIFGCTGETVIIPPVTVTLFSDGFTDLSRWTIPSGNGTLDSTFGNPAPSLNIGESSTPMFMNNAFIGTNGFTLSFDVACVSRGTSNNRTLLFEIYKDDSSGNVGSLGLNADSTTGVNLTSVYTINGDTIGTNTVVNTFNSTFHHYVFTLSKNSGNASWSRDAIAGLTGHMSLPGSLKIRMRKYGTDSYRIDNLVITTP